MSIHINLPNLVRAIAAVKEAHPTEDGVLIVGAYPELFGEVLDHAFADGWVSIRRWTGDQEVWAIRRERFHPVADTLSRWASACLQRFPNKAETPRRIFMGDGETPTSRTLAELAAGCFDFQ